MATSDATARIHADALKSLKDTATQIAAQLGIEPPQLAFFFKNKDYQQAQELAVLAGWLTTVSRALAQIPSKEVEGGGDVNHTQTKSP